LLGRTRRIFGRAKLAVQNHQFKRWQLRNPGATFKSYFAGIVKDDLAYGRWHPSLGHRWTGTLGELNPLLKRRLQPDDVCVDYGCGTLRVGVRAIRFLERGCYWGLDIDQALLDEGAQLIGPELESKAPNLRVISPATVREAADAKPALLFSLKVLIHVHPDELNEYFENILTIIGESGRAIITGKWSPDRTFQLGRQSWAHSLHGLTEIVARKGGRLTLLQEKTLLFSEIGNIGRGGALEASAASTFRFDRRRAQSTLVASEA
jgi:SAM-dependent methyltransferase